VRSNISLERTRSTSSAKLIRRRARRSTQPLGVMELAVHPAVLPGLAERFLKVNHAGEHGAICIYTAQIHVARWTARSMVPELVEFRSHELRHRSIFLAELQRRNRPRCRSYWLCGAGGYLLGFVMAICGRSAIAATTAAVEKVVLRHLQQQLTALGTSDPQATVAISAIISDEQEHHDRADTHAKAGWFWPKVISPIVTASTEFVIWSGMRL
jgi:ubiquinone biosynthesis monooxygenase Coq7